MSKAKPPDRKVKEPTSGGLVGPMQATGNLLDRALAVINTTADRKLGYGVAVLGLLIAMLGFVLYYATEAMGVAVGAQALYLSSTVGTILCLSGIGLAVFQLKTGSRIDPNGVLTEVIRVCTHQYDKQDLRISIKVKRVYLDRMVALVEIRSSYTIINTSNAELSYPFRAHFEVGSRATKNDPQATLRVTPKGGSPSKIDAAATFGDKDGARGNRYYEKLFQIPAGGPPFEFEWECQYEVDLPYHEFWATAHVTNSLILEIEAPADPPLDVVLQEYRDGRLGKSSREADAKSGRWRIDCPGWLLPYNGVYVCIRISHGNIT